jgi:hypothetical protein
MSIVPVKHAVDAFITKECVSTSTEKALKWVRPGLVETEREVRLKEIRRAKSTNFT